MKVLPECYVCAMRQALQAACLATEDEVLRYEVMREAAGMISDLDPGQTPPEWGERIYGMVSELTGNPDPFAQQKEEQNRAVLEILPWLREKVAGARDSLEMAVRLAIAGNAVDPGAQESFDLEMSVNEALGAEGPLPEYEVLSRRLQDAGTVLMLADNSGEIIFDRLLIETLTEREDPDITLAARAAPIINDVTVEDALALGFGELCRVISSGVRMPGTVLSRTTEEFRDAFASADVVISKGQGNWETLEDAPREVFFLFQAKCVVVTRMTGYAEGNHLLLRRAGPGSDR